MRLEQMFGLFELPTSLLLAASAGAGFLAGFVCGSLRGKPGRQRLTWSNRSLAADIATMRAALEDEIEWRLAAEKLEAQPAKPGTIEESSPGFDGTE
jgi:hypothetical protein